MKAKRRFFNLILALFILTFLACLFFIGRYLYEGYRYRKMQSNLVKLVHGGIAKPNETVVTYDKCLTCEDVVLKRTANTTSCAEIALINANSTSVEDAFRRSFEEDNGYLPEEMTTTEEVSLWQEQYAALVAINPDCVGFLEIPNTPVQFPVMLTADDPKHYLYRDFYRKSEKRGTPFLDGATVLGESQNYIIYGHNMKDGSVFGTLPSYLVRDYCEKHKLIYFNTAVSEGVYEVVAVCLTEVLAKDSSDFKYYQYGGPLSQGDFEIYSETIKSMAKYLRQMDIEWGDELLTLSTCYHRRAGDDGRLIVVAKRIR